MTAAGDFRKADVILDNLNEYYKKNLLSNDVKSLLFEIKKNHCIKRTIKI